MVKAQSKVNPPRCGGDGVQTAVPSATSVSCRAMSRLAACGPDRPNRCPVLSPPPTHLPARLATRPSIVSATMSTGRNTSREIRPGGGAFASTRWTLVLAAGASDSDAARPALEALCHSYWLPLYAFARRLGKSPEDARDLTQGFFERLLEKRWISTADPERGRFRTFLLTAFRRYVAGEDRYAHAARRGGSIEIVPIDREAEARLGGDLADWRTPELAYDEAWAAALLESALARLHDEFALHGRGAIFDALREFLTGDPPADGMAAVTTRLGMTEGAARMNLTRLRQRYRQILRSEIAQTVATPQDIDEELRHLYRVLTHESR